MNMFCIYMTACNVQLAIRCNVCCMIIFSLVTAGNLLVNGWLSYMMLAPITTSGASLAGSLDGLGSAFGSLANSLGSEAISSSLSNSAAQIGGGFSLFSNSGLKTTAGYMAPICIMIGIITLLGNIFYGVYICKMRNLQNDASTPVQQIGNIGVNRVIAGNNDIEMKRLQQANVDNFHSRNQTNSFNSNTTMNTDNGVALNNSATKPLAQPSITNFFANDYINQ